MPTLQVMSDYLRRQCNETSATTTGSGENSVEQIDQEMGNAAMCAELKVEGALGRAFNRIAGVSESNQDPSGVGFTNAERVKHTEHTRFLCYLQGSARGCLGGRSLELSRKPHLEPTCRCYCGGKLRYGKSALLEVFPENSAWNGRNDPPVP